MKRISSILAFIAGIALPSLFFLTWLYFDNSWPRDDGLFSTTAYRNYLAFRAGGFAGLLRQFATPVLKPSIHPALTTPLLLLSNGNLLLAIKLFILCTNVLFLVFLWKTLRLFQRRFEASLVTSFVATLPWFLPSTFVFNTEGPLAAFSMWACYACLKSRWFQSTAYSLAAGLAVTLVVCERPAEGILLFAPVFMAMCFSQVCSKKLNRNFLIAVSVFMLMTTFWMSPRLMQMSEWIRRAAFSNEPRVDTERDFLGIGLWGELLVRFCWQVPLFITPLLLSLVFSRGRRKRVARAMKRYRKELLVALAMIGALPLSSIFVNNWDMRYYFVPFLLFYSALCILALNKQFHASAFTYWLSVVLVFGVTLLHARIIVAINFTQIVTPTQHQMLQALLKDDLLVRLPRPVNNLGNPRISQNTFLKLKSETEKMLSGNRDGKVCVYETDNVSHLELNEHDIDLVNLYFNTGWNWMTYLFQTQHPSPRAPYEWALSNCNYLVLGPLDSTPKKVLPSWSEPIISRWKATKSAATPLNPLGEAHIPVNDGQHLTFVVFQNSQKTL